MILHYTKHAEKKFYVLQRHGRQVFKEDINDIIKLPTKTAKKHNLFFVEGCIAANNEYWEVIYRKEESVIHILTFYPLA